MTTQNNNPIFSIGKSELFFDAQTQRFNTESRVFQTTKMSNVFDLAKWQAVDDVKQWDGLIQDHKFDTQIVSETLKQIIGLPEYNQIFFSGYEGLQEEERLSVWLDAICFALNYAK